MTNFTLDLISKGEDLMSVRILLETEWPKLTDCVNLGWLEYLVSEGISPHPITPTVGQETEKA